MKIIAAEYILPISSPAVRGGGVVVEAGRIISVGEIQHLKEEFPETEIEDYGTAAIIPGLVNCHSHLEITSMRGALDDVEHDFSSWLLKLNSIRQGLSDEQIRDAAVLGAREGAQAGVTCFGDIGRFGEAGLAALKEVGLRGVVFQETEFSPDDSTADADLDRLIAKFEALKAEETELVKAGISPHSPYTVSPRLFRMITRFALENGVDLSIHAAESLDEDELMKRGTGFFTDVYQKYGVTWESPRCSTIEYLDRLGVLEAAPLLAHCVTVSASDLELIAASGTSVAHCPKSNAKFGHGYAPLEAMLDAGVAVGLGSDSVASNNVLDIIEESRFASLSARNRPGSRRFIGAREMLEAATMGGARAMKLADNIGSLEAGKSADLAVISLDHAAQQPINDIYAAIVFASNARDVKMTMVNGVEIHRRQADLT